MNKYTFKIILTFLCLIFTIYISLAQTVTIGSGTTDRWIPINPYYAYTYSQSIFDQSEIAIAGDIDKIRYYFNGNSAFTDNPVNVYIGHTTKSIFTSTTDWIPTSSMTLVYSGIITTTTTAGWVEIDISNFSYNNINNLVVAVHEAQSSFYGINDDYYSTACTGNKTIYKYRDTPTIDPAAPPSGSIQSYRPNIQLEFIAVTPMTYVSSTVTQTNTSTVLPSSTNREIIGIKVLTSGSVSPFDLTQFQINMNGSTNGVADVSNIDIYYTGTSNTFATTTLFGSSSPTGGTININGTQTMANGSNYFWVVYDIAGGATPGNFIDAECPQITMNGGIGVKTPSITSPTGKREIVLVPPTYLMNNTSVNTCYGVFYDSGGNSSNYTDNESYIKTFCSDNGDNLRFDFTSFNLQNTWDWLRIFDGPNTSSTLIGTYTSVVPVSIISTGTCLTFEFVSDGFVNQGGWSANISCFDAGVCGVNPPASDLCINAPLLSSLDGICGTTGGYTASDLTGTNLQTETCAGVNFINNNSWLQFQASATTVELAILCNCSGSGVEVSIFETTDCITFAEMGCYDPFYEQAPGVFTITGLTVGNYYYIMVDQFSAAGCNFQINGLSGIVLPITLSDIKATCISGLLSINWTTTSEINNDYFTIERSEDGKTFKAIGTVIGAGNSSIMLNYSFIDDEPLNNINYYRLKQTDFDGKFAYSKIIVANCKENETFCSIFPNPAKNQLTFTYKNPFKSNNYLQLKIINSLGKVVLNNQYKLETLLRKMLNISNLNNGIYQVIFTTDSNKEVHKLVIH